MGKMCGRRSLEFALKMTFWNFLGFKNILGCNLGKEIRKQNLMKYSGIKQSKNYKEKRM